MYKTFFWIYVVSTFTLVSAKANYAKLPDEVKKDIRHKWEECCKANMCIDNSCFIVQWAASKWAAVRQRCQSQYPEWPYTVDIFRIQNEADLRTFWTMLQDRNLPNRGNRKSFWTSGARCPDASTAGTNLVTRWVSTNEQFPAWLDEKINKTYNSTDVHSNRCEFLVVSPAENVAEVKYDFQDQNAHHATICEFSFPGVRGTTTTVSTSKTATKEILSTTTKSEEPSNTVSKEVTTQVTDIQTRFSEIESTGPSSSVALTIPTEVPTIPITSTETPRYCEAVKESGIYWPKTKVGQTIRIKCPPGMTGEAEWRCDEETAKFWPRKPQVEGCKHEWIDRLEDKILNGHDAVEISTQLSKETKNNNMSHGDIIALVNITANLFNLYIEQKQEEEFEVLQNEEMPIYYNFTKTMISSVSNILRVEIRDAWEGLNDTRQTKEASTILKLVTTMGSRLSCIKISSDKLQLTVLEENIDLQTFILNNTSENKDFVRFPQEIEGVEASSFITLPANLKLEKWYSPCKNYRSAVGVVYKHVGDFLKAGQQENTKTKVATKVLSFSLSNSTQTISLSKDRVAITLQHLKTERIRNQILENPRCVFWNFSKSAFGAWDETGCTTLYFNETHTVCECDHLTNFAVLMDINDNIIEDEILTWLTYVCCGFSSVSLVLTLICFFAIRSLHGRRSIITGNLCFSLLVSNALIIFGLDKTENKIICAIVAGVLHYWILSAFCWMLVEGYHLYRMVILVFQRGSNLPVKFYYLFAYGLPLVIVGISAGVRYEGYGGSKYCWLSAADDTGLIWSFVGPACVIILVNIVIFVLTLRSASSVKIKREQSTITKIKSWIRGSISVMCLLGLTWCIGLFYINKNLHFFSYIFTVLNGLQGVFIFFFHILLNDKVNSFFSCKENSKYGRKKFLNHTSSNQTNSKTSTRTSMNSLAGTSITKVSAIKNTTSTSRESIVLSNRIEAVENGKSFKKNKVMHAVISNGFKPQPTHHDIDVRIRSVSNYGAHGNLPQTSQNINLAKF